MAAKSPDEAIDNFLATIRETLNCVTDDVLLAYRQSEKLYTLLFKEPAIVWSKTGAAFYILVTQTFTVEAQQDGLFRVHTREYSYVFSDSRTPTTKGILAYTGIQTTSTCATRICI